MARRITLKTLAATIVISLLVLVAAPLVPSPDGSAGTPLPATVLQSGLGTVNVTATDNANRTLKGVILTLENESLTFVEVAVTDENGSATFSDVPASAAGVNYTLSASLTGYLSGEDKAVRVFEDETNHTRVVLIGGAVSGLVMDTAGRPVRATISVVSMSPPISTVCLETGLYYLIGLPGVLLRVNASATGFKNDSVYLTPIPGDVVPKNFILEPLNGIISGHVYHAVTGEPLEDANVSVRIGGVTKTVPTEPDGSYDIRDVAEGSYVLTAEKQGYNAATRTAEVTKGNLTEGIDFNLTEKETRVYGIVRSGTLLLVGVNVSVFGTSLYNLSGPDGSYEIRNLTVGVYILTAAAFGYQTQTASNLVITVGAQVQHNFNMVGLPGAILRGKVYLANTQEPITNVQITIVNLKPQPISKVTNINGEFEFAGLVPGDYTIHLEKNGYRPIEVDKILVTNATPVNLTLEMMLLREGFEGFIFGFDMAHSMMILALFLTTLILAVAIYLRVRSFQTPESAPAIYDEPEEGEEGATTSSEEDFGKPEAKEPGTDLER